MWPCGFKDGCRTTTLPLTACTPPLAAAPPPTPALPPPAVQRGIAQGVTFLQNQYDADLSLLRESPVTAPDHHWLLTDNRLAQ